MASHNVYQVHLQNAAKVPEVSPGAPAHPAAFSSNLQKSWVEFLGRFQLDWFCTMTFRDDVHPEAADKLWRVWVSKLNRRLYGVRWYRQDHTSVFWIRALEWQRRGVVHYHAMVGDHKDLNHEARARRLDLMDLWFDMAGIARIDPISRAEQDQRQAINSYVSKYVSKGGEIDFSPSLRFYVSKS